MNTLGPVLLIALLLLCGTVIFGGIAVIWKLSSWVGSGFQRMFGDDPTPPIGHPRRGGPVMCGNPRCGKVEYRQANYCSQCGQKLLRGSRRHLEHEYA